MSLAGVVVIVDKIFDLYEIVIVVHVIMSWIPNAEGSQIASIVSKLVEPVLAPCRDILSAAFRFLRIDMRTMPIDFSPVLAIVLVHLVHKAVVMALLRFL
jgi:YggT family protein